MLWENSASRNTQMASVLSVATSVINWIRAACTHAHTYKHTAQHVIYTHRHTLLYINIYTNI